MLSLSKRVLSSSIVAVSVVLFIGGCSSKSVPMDTISSAESAINRASENKAEVYAPLELRIAKEKFEKAKELLKDKKYEEAKMLAEEAEVDARLAEEKSRTKEAKKIADEILDSINALKEEIKRLRSY